MKTKTNKKLFFVIMMVLVSGFAITSRVLNTRNSPSVSAQTAQPAPPPGGMDRSIFQRQDFLYGSEIIGYPPPVGNGRYDDQPTLNNPYCRQLITQAKIPVMRWGVWNKFPDMVGNNQCPGWGGCLPREQFDNIIDGIRSMGIVPFVKGPPGDGNFCAAIEPEINDPSDDPIWYKEIIKQAGNRVQLYEFGNESADPWHCGWGWVDGGSGVYGKYWINTVPKLKKYARSLGFEIFIGGPASEPANIEYFLREVRAEYDRTGDKDVIPDFVSLHSYGNSIDADGVSPMGPKLWWPSMFDNARKSADQYFPPSLLSNLYGIPQYKLPVADSEWNYTVSETDTRYQQESHMKPFTQGMIQLMRDKGVWMSNLFLSAAQNTPRDFIRFENGQCVPQPQYYALKDCSTNPNSICHIATQPVTPQPTPTSVLITPTQTVSYKPTPTPTPASLTQWSSSTTIIPTSVNPGQAVSIAARVTSPVTISGHASVNIYSAANERIAYQYYTNQLFPAGQTISLQPSMNWTATIAGSYTIKIFVSSSDWSTNLHANNDTGTLTVASSSLPTTVPLTPTFTPIPTRTPTPPSVNKWNSSATASPTTIARGKSISVYSHFTAPTNLTAHVTINVYNANNVLIYQDVKENQQFFAGKTNNYTTTWNTSGWTPTGTYSIILGAASTDWNTNYVWNTNAATVKVSRK